MLTAQVSSISSLLSRGSGVCQQAAVVLAVQQGPGGWDAWLGNGAARALVAMMAIGRRKDPAPCRLEFRWIGTLIAWSPDRPVLVVIHSVDSVPPFPCLVFPLKGCYDSFMTTWLLCNHCVWLNHAAPLATAQQTDAMKTAWYMGNACMSACCWLGQARDEQARAGRPGLSSLQ